MEEVLFTFGRYVAITPEEMRNILSSVNKLPPVLSGIDLLKEVCRFCMLQPLRLLPDKRLCSHLMTGSVQMIGHHWRSG